MHYIEKNKIDEQIVKSICETFSRPYTPNNLERHLRNYFADRLHKKQEFNEVLKGLPGMDLPGNLEFIRILE
ncbi:MAG TPA: hypothetical protein VKZ95_03295 [Sphingobacteriaceae bacterium]|nr:hypothetical protein [Sphingobacteriaceae bacterium]